MLKKLLLTVCGVVSIVALLAYSFFGLMIPRIQAFYGGMTPPSTAVTTMVVKEDSWQPTLSSVGTLSAVQGVILSAQLDGAVTKINFTGGAEVKQGDLLVQMDVSAEEAQLSAAQAAMQLSQVNLRRSSELLQKNTISQAQVDTDQAGYKQAVAQAKNIEAVLAKKTIRAPFSGKLGVRLVNLGQTLKAGDPIVSLQALDPIFADFFLPQQRLGQVTEGMDVRVTCDAFPGKEIMGKITAINPEVDATTRNVRLQATLANGEKRLRPGMFVSVDVLLPKTDKVLAVPLTAVAFAPYGDSIFIVKTSKDAKTGAVTKVARQQTVRLGVKRGDFVAVLSGVAAGDEVVTSGVFKLRSGAQVAPNNAMAPDAQLAPKPTDS